MPSIHRAANQDFDPTDYELVRVYDRKALLFAGMDKFEFAPDVPHISRCSHCGKSIRYGAVLRHTSGLHITVGETCLGGRFSGTKAQFAAARELAKAQMGAFQAKMWATEDADERAKAYEDKGLSADAAAKIEAAAQSRWGMFEEHPVLVNVTYPEMFGDEPEARGLALDFERYLTSHAVLTDQQIAYFERLHKSGLVDMHRAEEKSRYVEESVALGFAAPRGDDVTVTGTIVWVKEKPSHFAYNATEWKMKVALPGGANVHSTAPKAIRETADAGDRIEFTADFIAPKDDDPMFAYAKRPRKVRMLDDD